LVDAVIARVEAAPNEYIHTREGQGRLEGERRDAVNGRSTSDCDRLGSVLEQKNYISESPGLKYDLVKWVLDMKLGILGADMPSFDRMEERISFPSFSRAIHSFLHLLST